jgi:hypothetical protein
MAPLIFLMSLHTQQRSTLMAKNTREPSSTSFSPAQSESESLNVFMLPIWASRANASSTSATARDAAALTLLVEGTRRGLMDSTQFTRDDVDLDACRARLRKMTDEELIREGKAGRYLCSPLANFGKTPRKVIVVQLEEVKAEWRRRHPKTDSEAPPHRNEVP